jgi:arginase family enzyme
LLKAVILNTDNSVTRQGLNHNFEVDAIDLTDIRTHLQFYADRYGTRSFSDRTKLSKEAGPTLHLLGSGDFHHLTLMILEQIATPFLLVVFDNHPDCSFIGPKYHCGNWLYHAANLPHCRKILHVGATERQGMLMRYMGIRLLLKKEKLAQLPGSALTGSDCVDTFIDALSFHNPDRLPVYASVDKDVLNQEESPGDWDNGVMSMVHLSRMLDHIIRSYPVTGADITGEMGGSVYYPYKPVKNILSRIEHRACRNSATLLSAVAKQRTINFELMSILGVPRVG